MRILNLTEFRAMPEGTIYKSATVAFAFGDWHIKGETWEVDFVCTTMDWVDCDSSWMLDDRMFEMWDDSSASYPLAWSYGRDGMFQDEAKFMILEKKDLELFKEAVEEAIQAASTSPSVHS